MNKKRTVWISGHKNPDTDSICSAIAYAHLKNSIDQTKNYVPIRCGHMNEETHYVLNYFGIKKPKYITSVQAQVSDIDFRDVNGIDRDMSLKKAWETMKVENVMTLPIVEDEELKGLITVGDIATAYMDVADNRILATAKTPYKNIVETLKGEMILGDEQKIFSEGKVLIAAATPDQVEEFIDPHDIVILGNRYESQLCAIEMDADCIIVTQSTQVSKTIQKLAADHDCAIIVTPYDTYTAARMLNQSMPVGKFMNEGPLRTFHLNDSVSLVKETMAKLRHRYFPIVNDDDHLLGFISKRNLLDMTPKAVILVDHNEKSQAIDGIDEAEVLEIIDHHRIGSLETMTPVYFRNMPLGCTASIIYMMYQENQVEIPKEIAGLLCGAILSDTLMYRSPTCTEFDKNTAEKLAKIAGIDVESFAAEMFHAGSNFEKRPIKEVFNQDLKKFSVGEATFEVGQINYMTDGEVDELKGRLIKYMEKEIEEKSSLDAIYFMLTSIVKESTELLFVGQGVRDLVDDAFHEDTKENSVWLPGVVSRKKQLVPSIMGTMNQ